MKKVSIKNKKVEILDYIDSQTVSHMEVRKIAAVWLVIGLVIGNFM